MVCLEEQVSKTFQYYMAYGDFKGLPKRTTSDKVLLDKTFNIAKNPKYDGYQRGLNSFFCKFFNKTALDGTVTRANNSVIKSEFITNQNP